MKGGSGGHARGRRVILPRMQVGHLRLKGGHLCQRLRSEARVARDGGGGGNTPASSKGQVSLEFLFGGEFVAALPHLMRAAVGTHANMMGHSRIGHVPKYPPPPL